MKIYQYVLICSSLIVFSSVNLQEIQYANRFRNFTIESETDSVYVINMTIFQDKIDHKLAGSFNVTKDIYIKNIIVTVNRCNFEKAECEYFQKWNFSDNFKTTLYLKNQIWTPLIKNITPKLDPPLIKKNVYSSRDGNINCKAVLALYSEAANYFWRVDLALNDTKGKKAAIFRFETEFFGYSKRDRKRDREGATTKKS